MGILVVELLLQVSLIYIAWAWMIVKNFYHNCFFPNILLTHGACIVSGVDLFLSWHTVRPLSMQKRRTMLESIQDDHDGMVVSLPKPRHQELKKPRPNNPRPPRPEPAPPPQSSSNNNTRADTSTSLSSDDCDNPNTSRQQHNSNHHLVADTPSSNNTTTVDTTWQQQRQQMNPVASVVDHGSNESSSSSSSTRSSARRRLSFYLEIMRSKLRWFLCIPATPSTTHRTSSS